LVTAIRDRLSFSDLPFPVSYSGGLFNTGELVLSRFSKGVTDASGELVKPILKPAQGALLLAYEKFCADGSEEIRRLMEDNNGNYLQGNT